MARKWRNTLCANGFRGYLGRGEHPLLGGAIVIGVQAGADRLGLRYFGGLASHIDGQISAQLRVDVGPAVAPQEARRSCPQIVGGDVVAIGDGGGIDESPVIKAGEARASGAVGVIANRSDDSGELTTPADENTHTVIVARIALYPRRIAPCRPARAIASAE